MDKQSYIKKKDKLDKEYAKKLFQISKEFTESNRQFDIGDTVQATRSQNEIGVVIDYGMRTDFTSPPELYYTCKYLDNEKTFHTNELRLKLIKKYNQ